MVDGCMVISHLLKKIQNTYAVLFGQILQYRKCHQRNDDAS